MAKPPTTKDEIADRCIQYAAKLLNVPPGRINVATKFSRLGLDSAMSVSLILALEEALEMEISPEVIFEYATIDRLSDHLARLGAAPAGSN